jgi:hypothetical protein
MSTTFELNISYSQITIFDRAAIRPFSMWTEQHMRQGFAWRERAVSFLTMSDGPHLIEVIVSSSKLELPPDAPRIILTPFLVPPSCTVEVASIADEFPLELPSGMHALRFECFRIEPRLKPRIRIVMTRTDHPTFEVLRADSELSLSDELLHTAEEA